MHEPHNISFNIIDLLKTRDCAGLWNGFYSGCGNYYFKYAMINNAHFKYSVYHKVNYGETVIEKLKDKVKDHSIGCKNYVMFDSFFNVWKKLMPEPYAND